MAEYEQFHPQTREQWRAWLEQHHDSVRGVLVVQWRSGTGRPRVPYEDLVEEAVCFGWIDSRLKRLDGERSALTMTPRRPDSGWSRSNKERVDRLTRDGRMAAAGLRAVEVARANGAWQALDDVEALVLPDDLVTALAADERAAAFVAGLSPSRLRMVLFWISSARRPQTRARRITETVRAAAEHRAPGPVGG